MMLQRAWLTYSAIGLIVMLLTGCPGTETPEPTRDARRLMGTAVTQTKAAYNGPAEDVFITNENFENVLQVGSISATGEVDVNLPETLPETLLVAVQATTDGDEDALLPATCIPNSTLTVSDLAAKAYVLGSFFQGLATSSQQGIYEFDSQTPAFPQDTNAIDWVSVAPDRIVLVTRFYSDRDVIIEGLCDIEEEEDGSILRIKSNFDLALRRGWNYVTLTFSSKIFNNGAIFETRSIYTLGVIPEETTLFIFPAD
ncbi:MAG: hypothetical protein AAF267_10860 [Deinococcota bacterium]